eukprot:11809342-Ditylum_brightwellii.AAC.1
MPKETRPHHQAGAAVETVDVVEEDNANSPSSIVGHAKYKRITMERTAITKQRGIKTKLQLTTAWAVVKKEFQGDIMGR